MCNKSIAKITKLLLALTFVIVPTANVSAQAPAGGGISGPIDIQATEQEFEGDHVVAKGGVRVKYKDSIISGPEAVLYKDATGAMQKAVFTGHPHLVQNTSKMDADTLTFEIASQQVVADGHSHSEVAGGGGDDNKDGSKAPQGDQQAGQTIITDADHQEYDQTGGKFTAAGHVHVLHGDIDAHSEKLNLIYGNDNKPETAIFTGNANAKQNANSTKADTITYYLKTSRLQAMGHVQSKVIQPKKADDDDDDSAPKQPLASANPLEAPAQAAEAPAAAPQTETITILSDSQDMSEETGRINCDGNVKLYYEDTIGVGPKMIVARNKEGKPKTIYFIGRSQVLQPGKRWIGDRITFNCANKRVQAFGNTRAILQQQPPAKTAPAPAPQEQIAKKKKDEMTM